MIEFVLNNKYESDIMNNLKIRNSKKNKRERKKAGLPLTVTGICPLCEVNLYGKNKKPLPLNNEQSLNCHWFRNKCYFE